MLHSRRRATIIALSVLLVFLGGITYTIVSLDTLVAGIVENRVNGDTPGRFEVRIDRLRLHPGGGIAADTIVLSGADPTQEFSSVTLTEIQIDAALVTVLRRNTPLVLTMLRVESVTVLLRPQQDQRQRSDRPERSEVPPSLDLRIGRIETAVFRALETIAPAPPFETEVRVQRSPANTIAEGTLTLQGSTAALVGSYGGYEFQLDVSDTPRTIGATMRRPGTEIRVSAVRGSASGSIDIDGGDPDSRSNLPFGLDRYISRIGGVTGAVSLSYNETGETITKSSVLQPLFQPVDQLIEEARIVGDLKFADTSARYDGIELPSELTITAGSFSVTEEDGVFRLSGGAQLRNGTSLELADVSIPLEAPWESSFATATLYLPLDTPVPTKILPDGVVNGLLPHLTSQTVATPSDPRSSTPPLPTVGDTDYAPLPEISVELSKPEKDPASQNENPSVIGVVARIERPGRIRLTADATIDIEARRIVDSTTVFSWRSVPVDDALWWEITGESELSAPFDVLSPSAASPIPAAISGTFELDGTNTETEVAIGGRIEDGTIHVSRGNAIYRNRRYVLVSDTAISTAADDIVLATTPITVGSGRVILAGEASEGTITGTLSIDRVPVSWFLSEESRYSDTNGFISGDLSFRQDEADRPEITATLQGEELSILGSDGTGRIEIHHDARGFEIVSGSLAIEPLIEGTIEGRLPLAIGAEGFEFLNLAGSSFRGTLRSAEFERFFPPSKQGLVPAGRLEIDARLEERTGDLRSTIRFLVRSEEAGDTLGVGTTATGFGYERLSSTLRLRERDGDRLTVGVDVSADNETIATVSSTMTIPGLSAARPTFDPKDIEWQITGTSALPLEYIAPFVPGVIAMTGGLNGAIDVRGTVASPIVEGSISIGDGELRLNEPIPPISALSGTIRFDGETYSTESFSGETGLAPFTVDISGRFPSDDLSGSTRVRVNGENVLLASTPTVRLRAATDVEITGSNREGYTFGGTISVTEGIYSQDIPLIDFDSVPRIDTEMLQLFSVGTPLGEKTDLALDIRSDATFRVENNIYEGPLSADLTLGGTLAIPQPEGRIFTDRGTLQLPLTTISVRQGSLQFPADSPFSPVVRAQGSARIRDYQVTALVSGQLPGVEINLSSTPPLSQSEALVLLTTGLTPRELSESGNRSALAIGSRLGTQFVRSLVGTAGGDVGTDLADRVSVILGEGVSESGDETIEIEFRLSDEDSWFLVFRRDRFERYNLDLSWRFWLE